MRHARSGAMKAALLEQLPAAGLRIVDVPEPRRAHDDEVIVEVEACGICGTDLHILAGESYRPELPFVLGHEPIGTVVVAGEAMTHWIGCRVAMSLFEGCGRCAYCEARDERLCPQLRSIVGVSKRWGGFAERLSVPARQLVELPANLSSLMAATLVDAGATAANAAELVKVDEPDEAVVVGGGPVGYFVAELLSVAGIRVCVVEPNPVRRAKLDELNHRTREDMQQIDWQPACIVECTGSPLVPPWALERLKPRGLLILAGYAVAELDLAHVARKELRVLGVRAGNRSAVRTALMLAAEQTIRLPEISTWSLTSINDALGALREGSVPGKAVIKVANC